MEIRCGGLLFFSNFDSGNLGLVEKVEKLEDEENEGTNFIVPPDYEFNVQTKPDCAGTEHENGNRSWFYFGVRGYASGKLIKINITNMNRQGKLYSQGMAPMVRQPPHKSKWVRIRDRPRHDTVNGQFRLSFCHRFSEGRATYFAFCYPYSYAEQQNALNVLDLRFRKVIDEIQKPNRIVTNETELNENSDSNGLNVNNTDESILHDASTDIDPTKTQIHKISSKSSIYYYREVACLTIDGRNCDVITITSHHGITNEREPRICGLFTDESRPRPHKFNNKRIFFLSSRVHPGETPASHVFNGFIQFILDEEDERAKLLRNKFVFKLIPMLNPDGVSRGHYRTDNLGCNLNRVYKNPSKTNHPTIYASKALMLFYHLYYSNNTDQVKEITGGKDWIDLFQHDPMQDDLPITSSEQDILTNQMADVIIYTKRRDSGNFKVTPPSTKQDSRMNWYNMEYSLLTSKDSGVAYYIDLHGHASKRGCFIYGNHLDRMEDQVDNQLYAKLVSLNSPHFDYNACNFTTKNMYMRDKRDGMCKDGSGRVAIYKATGIVHSYTLECNYNTGITINPLPSNQEPVHFPPRYTPVTWQGVGKALAVAALDMIGENPSSNVQLSEFNTLDSVRLSVLRQLQNSRSNTSFAKKSTSRKWSKTSCVDRSEPADASPNYKPKWTFSGHVETKNNSTVTRKLTNHSPPNRKISSRSPVNKKLTNHEAANNSSSSSTSTRSSHKKFPQSKTRSKTPTKVVTPSKLDFVTRNKNLIKVSSQSKRRKGVLLQPTKTNFSPLSMLTSQKNNFPTRSKLSQNGSQSDSGFSLYGEIVPGNFSKTRSSSFDRNFLPAVDIGKNEKFGLPAANKWTKNSRKTWNKKLSISPDFPQKKPSKGSNWSKKVRKSSDWSKKIRKSSDWSKNESNIPDWVKKSNCRLRISP